MAEDRKIFPVEQVLELVTGKNGADTSAISAFITGRANLSPEAAKAAAPFAYAWLVRWHPKFMDMEWKEDQSWEAYLRQASHILGDKVSLMPMSGRFKNVADEALNAIEDSQAALTRQMDAAMKLEKEVKRLEPLQMLLETAQKKNDQLEAKIKSMKTDMNALNRKAMEFEGKVAIDQDELMRSIKDAIKDGMKGLAVAASAVAGTSAGASEATAAPAQAENKAPEDEWGFGGSDSQGEFGF